MNEEAVKTMYALAQQQGYQDSQADFEQLLATDAKALGTMYGLAQDKGYADDLESFEILMGLKKKEEPVVTESVSDAGSSEQRIASRDLEAEALAEDIRARGTVGFQGAGYNPYTDVSITASKSYHSPAEIAKRDSAKTVINTREANIAASQLSQRQEEAQRITADLPPVAIPEGSVTDALQQLRDLYGPYGLQFSEEIVPAAMTRSGSKVVKATVPRGAGGKPVEVRLELDEDGNINPSEASKVDALLRENATYVGETDTSFVEKALKVDQMRPVPRIDSSGVSTVKMASAEVDGKFIAYPTLFPKDPAGTTSTNPDDWMELDFGIEAQNEAFKRGEVFYFDTEEEARDFGAGAWKGVVPMDLEFQKRHKEMGRDYDSDMAFLDELTERRDEYKFIEDLPVPGARYEEGLIPASYQKYFIDGNMVRDDIETMRDEKEAELSMLEAQFDEDNVLLRLKEDRDVALGERFEQLSTESAEINTDAKTRQNQLQAESLKTFGVRLEDLATYEPKTEEELRGMIGLYNDYNQAASQRQAAALGYERAQTYYDKQYDKGITQEYVDGWEEVGVAWDNGLKRGNAMSKLLLMQMGYYNVIGDEGAEEQAMREVSEIMDSQDPRRGRLVSRANMTGTTDSYLASIASNPGMYTAAITAESLGQLAPIWARVLPAAAVLGAGYGAIGGPLGSFVGATTTTLGAAWAGTVAGVTMVGMPISELALEMGNSVLEVGERMGYDWSDPNSSLKALNDEKLWADAAERGWQRGIPIASMGLLSNFFIGAAVGRAASLASTGERVLRGVGTGLIAEPVTEALGEYMAIQTTGEYTGSTANFREIMAEAIGAVGMGVSMGAAFGAIGYAKQKLKESNFDLAVKLMDPMSLGAENVSGQRIMNWANKMEKLGQITPEQAEYIRKNTGYRRQANELLGRDVDARPGTKAKVVGRLMELLEAKDHLSKPGTSFAFGRKLSEINEEISYIAENQSNSSEQVDLSLIDTRTRQTQPGAYKFNGKNVSRQDFLSKIQEATPRQLLRANVYNDNQVAAELKAKRDAISKREATEVPVGKRTGFGSEVDEEVREITQEVINEQTEGKLDEDEIEDLLAPIAAKKARGESLTDLEQQFAETNSSLLKRVEKDLKDIDKLVGDPNAQEEEGVSVIGKLTDRGKAVGKQARKAAKALRAAFPEVKIVLHADDASFVEAAKGLGLKGTGRAFYGFESKEIHVHTGRAKNTTVAHEAFHAALRNSVDNSEVQALMGDFVTTLKKVIPADSDLAKKLDKFARDYKENRVDEEYVAEFFGELAAAYPTLDRKGKTAIARFLERLSNLIGIDLTLTPDLTKRDEQILSLLETLAGKVSRGKAIKGKQVSEFQELARSTSREQTEDNLGAAEQKVSDFSMQEIAGMSENGVVGHFTNETFDKFLPKFMKTGVYGAGFYFTGSTIIGKHYGKGPNATISFVDTNDMNLVDRDRVATPDELRSAANWLVDNDKEFLSDAMPEDTSPQDVAMMNLTSTPYDSMSERRSKMGESLTLGQLHTNLQENFDEYQIEDDMGVITPLFNEVYPEYQGIINRETESGTVVDMVIWDFDAINSNIVKPTRQFAEAAAKGNVSVADFTEIVYEPTVTPEERMTEMEEEMIRTKPEAEAALLAAEQRVDDLDTSIGKSVEFAEESTFDNKIEFKRALQERFNQLVLPELEARYGITDSSELNDNLKEYLVDAYMNETLNAIAAYPDALGWYDSRITGAMSLMSLLHPELATDPDAASAFKIGLAITSNGNKVYDNFVEANRQYKYYKENGRFDESRSIGNQVGGILSNLKFANEALGVMSMGELTQFLTTNHKVGSLSYRDSAGKKKNLISGFGVNEEVYGAAVFGPKIGNGFFMNLYGVFDQLTMDRWFMRQYGRLTGTLLDFDQKKVDTATKRLARARKSLLQRNNAKVEGLIGAFENLSDAELAQKVQKASVDIKKREVLKSNPKLDEFRKASNNLAKLLEAEVEAPTPAKRRFINEVFSELQRKLKDENGIDITIADLQAVNWYPEKALYQTFKEDQTQKSAKTETSDNEQPDYESAARKLVEKQGVTKEQIDGRQIERDDTAREADQQRATELLEDDEATRQLRDRVLSIREEVTTDDLKAAEQQVDVDTEGPTIVYRSGAVDSKAEPRGMMDGSRQTGHFGTGAYFFGDRESAEEYDDREVTAVDIRDYNLAPASKELHGALRDVNRYRYREFYGPRKEDEFDGNDFARVAMALGREEELFDSQDYPVQKARKKKLVEDAKRIYNEPGNFDSRSTVVMKLLGYDGVYATPYSDMDNSTYGTVIYDVKTEPKAAEQRVIEPGVVDVLERYEFKSNNSLKNAELTDELRRNLKRFGYGVKQYGTRMNDVRVISLDTGRAVDPNKIIAAGVKERAARVEEQRMFEAEQRARELEERIIEIYEADERPFTGRDFESQAAEQKQKIEDMSQPNDTMRDIVAKGREMGFRDSAIRAVLMKRYGRDSNEAINTALAENSDIFTVIPKAFGNVVGGLDVGRQIYGEVRAKLNEFMKPKSPGRMTKQQRADRIAELRKAHPKQSKLSDTQLLRKFPRPKATPTRGEMMAEALEILKANRRFKEQPEKVQKELLVGFATSLKSRANKGVQNLLSQIRRDLKERKKGAKTAREVQTQLRTLINEVLPKAEYSKAQVAKLTKVVNQVNEDNYIVKAQKVLDLVEEKREQIRKATIREIIGFVKRSAKTYKTPGGRIRTRGLDAPGRAFFLEAKRVLTAVFQKDQTDIMNIGFNLATNPEVDIATAKLMNGENLTVKEQMLLDQKDAYDLFAPLADMSLEQVEAVLEDLKVTAGFSRVNLKNIRMERAARLNALRQGAKDSVEGNWGGAVTKEVEKDGETKIVAKDSNELATDRANKKSLKDILDAQGLQGKYRTLVKWAADGQRMTPLMFGLGEWWAHLGTLTSVFGEFFNENIYNKINRMKEENLRGEYAQKEKLNDIANSIDGITNGYEEITQLIFTGGKTRVLIADEQGLTLSVKAGRRKFTTDELMRIYALSKNPIQRAKLERQGFTDEVMAGIEEFLDPRLTEFVDKTVEYLSNEYYEGVNDVYVKVNDVNLGYMENYFPTRTQFQGDLSTQSKDQLLSSTYSGPNSQMAGALKERVDTGSDILMNEGLGFHSELGNHINTMERFKAYSVGVQEINAILSDSFTVSLSELLGLGRALNDGVSAAVMPDVFKSDLDFNYIDTLMSMMVGAALSFKPMQIIKQTTSAIGGFKDYQYGKEKNLPVDILMFSMDFARLLPKLILEGVSLGKYKGPVSTMMEDSATLRRRIEDNFGGDLYGLTSGVSGRTRRITATDYTLAAKAIKGLAQAGGTATSAGDVAGVMGYLPAYMRDIQNGMSKEEAIEKFNQYNKTQQSRRESERAPIQTYQMGLLRLFTAFTSSQLLYLNEIATTSNNMLKSIRKGEKIKASDSRGYALALFGYSVMFTLATNMWKLMFGDDEEKDKAWLDVALSPAKNYAVIPLLGNYMNKGYNWIVGNNYPSPVAKDPLQSTIREIEKAYKKEDYVRIGTEITEIGLGTNFDMFRGMMDIAKGQPMDESFYDVMGVPKTQRPESD
jgi:hypothetical protein